MGLTFIELIVIFMCFVLTDIVLESVKRWVYTHKISYLESHVADLKRLAAEWAKTVDDLEEAAAYAGLQPDSLDMEDPEKSEALPVNYDFERAHFMLEDFMLHHSRARTWGQLKAELASDKRFGNDSLVEGGRDGWVQTYVRSLNLPDDYQPNALITARTSRPERFR